MVSLCFCFLSLTYLLIHTYTVWDFDDDNVMINAELFQSFVTNTDRELQVIEPFVEKFRGEGNLSSADTRRHRRHPPQGHGGSRRLTRGTTDSDIDRAMKSFNPYPLMGAQFLPSWPRGLPIDDIKPSQTKKYSSYRTVNVSMGIIGVVQSLAQNGRSLSFSLYSFFVSIFLYLSLSSLLFLIFQLFFFLSSHCTHSPCIYSYIDPDVDAMYRLVQPVPFNFAETGPSVLVPSNRLGLSECLLLLLLCLHILHLVQTVNTYSSQYFMVLMS